VDRPFHHLRDDRVCPSRSLSVGVGRTSLARVLAPRSCLEPSGQTADVTNGGDLIAAPSGAAQTRARHPVLQAPHGPKPRAPGRQASDRIAHDRTTRTVSGVPPMCRLATVNNAPLIRRSEARQRLDPVSNAQ
jgi:hypothetical protein